MPCSQMISMNCMPPRPIEASRPARLPAENGPDPEQVHVEHRVGDVVLDEAEDDQQDGAADDPGQDPRVGPALRVAAVRLDAVGDRGQHARTARPRR